MTDFTKVIYIEGDGVGSEITPVMRAVLDAAMDKAYKGAKAIAWEEAFAGGKAEMLFGTNLPESMPQTCEILRRSSVTCETS